MSNPKVEQVQTVAGECAQEIANATVRLMNEHRVEQMNFDQVCATACVTLALATKIVLNSVAAQAFATKVYAGDAGETVHVEDLRAFIQGHWNSNLRMMHLIRPAGDDKQLRDNLNAVTRILQQTKPDGTVH